MSAKQWQSVKDSLKFRLSRGLGIETVHRAGERILSRIELAIDRAEGVARRLDRIEAQLAALTRTCEGLNDALQRLEGASGTIRTTIESSPSRARPLVRE